MRSYVYSDTRHIQPESGQIRPFKCLQDQLYVKVFSQFQAWPEANASSMAWCMRHPQAESGTIRRGPDGIVKMHWVSSGPFSRSQHSSIISLRGLSWPFRVYQTRLGRNFQPRSENTRAYGLAKQKNKPAHMRFVQGLPGVWLTPISGRIRPISESISPFKSLIRQDQPQVNWGSQTSSGILR